MAPYDAAYGNSFDGERRVLFYGDSDARIPDFRFKSDKALEHNLDVLYRRRTFSRTRSSPQSLRSRRDIIRRNSSLPLTSARAGERWLLFNAILCDIIFV